MDPIILYRKDIDWKYEEDIARSYFPCTNSRMTIKKNSLVIPRFSAVPFYKELEFDINYVESRLINTYNQHLYISDLGNWYLDLIGYTPKTWERIHDIPENTSFILKGETNSKKFSWRTHMFAENKKEAIQVYSRLMNDSVLQYQKIYIREYVKLEKLTDGLQDLPISREYRFFVYKNIILSGGFYWSSHYDQLIEDKIILNEKEVPIDFLNKIIKKIQNTTFGHAPDFYVIDVAKTDNGNWIVVELNDGSMSGLCQNDPEILYSNLKTNLRKNDY